MWSLLAALASAGPAPCGTLALLPSARELQRIPRSPALPPGELAQRDAYGVPNVQTSAHFAVRWGNGGAVASAVVDALLASLEDAWTVQVVEMAHPPPVGTDAYLFNVYVGDTGDGAPPGYGTGGYYWVDVDGAPMIVVSNATLAFADSADATAIHEFYHAIQGSLDRFPYDGLGAWFWEATAEWAAIETHPTNPDTGSLLFGYLLLPDLAVNDFDYPDSGALEEYHQYGAFLLPHYLTTRVVGFELVRDAWVVPGPNEDPLEVLREGLARDGIDFDAVWLDHLAANATYDYPQGEQWQAGVEAAAQWFGGGRPTTATTVGDGYHEPIRVEGPGRAPGRYGYNLIELEAPIPGDLEVWIAGDAQGDAGSPARFVAAIIQVNGGLPTVTPVPFDGATGQLTLPVAGADDLLLVVGAFTPDTAHWQEEAFPYTFTMSIGPPPPEGGRGVTMGNIRAEPPVPQVCAPVRPGALWLAAPALLVARRRRAR